MYVETYGDVSIFGKGDIEQIEVKFYKDDLTDVDHNIWNTLNNWLKDDFPFDTFSSLILLTTQKIKSTSAWYGWNDKSVADKLITLQGISSKYFRKKTSRDPKTEKLLTSVLDESKSNKLNILLSIFVIDNNARNDEKYYKSIKETYTKTLPEIRQDEFIRSMLGYVITPKTVNNNWAITYDEFTKEGNLLAQSLIDTTTQFPFKIKLKDIKHEEYNENVFVDKIRQIEYQDVVLDAIADYVQAKGLIMQEIQISKTISESLGEYEDSLYNRHKIDYRISIGNILSVL